GVPNVAIHRLNRGRMSPMASIVPHGEKSSPRRRHAEISLAQRLGRKTERFSDITRHRQRLEGASCGVAKSAPRAESEEELRSIESHRRPVGVPFKQGSRVSLELPHTVGHAAHEAPRVLHLTFPNGQKT